MPKAYVIAEVGSNWCKSEKNVINFNLAINQINAAKACGVNAVKFQLFDHESLYGTKKDMKESLPREWLPLLARQAKACGLDFLCSVFSPQDVAYIDKFVKMHKVASLENQYEDLIEAMMGTGKPIMISVGAMDDIAYTAMWLKYKNLMPLECVSSYPADPEDYNLKLIKHWTTDLVKCGVSDHTLGFNTAFSAFCMGASYFEKHFDGFPELGTTSDSCVSIGPAAMKKYATQFIDDNYTKQIQPSESALVANHRRRLIAVKDISPGETLVLHGNYDVKRPLSETAGYSPVYAQVVNGKKAVCEIHVGQGINESNVC